MGADRGTRIDAARRRVTVLLLDDRSVVASGCRALLEPDPTIFITGESSHFTEMPGLVAREPPRIVVTATAGGALGAVGLVCAIREVAPTAQVIVVSPRLEQAHVRSTLHAGARAYVLPDDRHLARAVRAVADGGAYFSPEIANLLREGYLEGVASAGDTLLGRLNDTERSVLRCLIDGLTPAETASRLHTSSAAVDAHRRRIVEVLAPSRAEAAAHKERAT